MSTPVKVLIVEDDPFLAIDLEDTLEAAGFDVSGPAASVSRGLELIERDGPSAATLDYNLGCETSDAIAKELRARQIPFCYISGNRTYLERVDEPVLDKPAAPRTVVRTMETLTGRDV